MDTHKLFGVKTEKPTENCRPSASENGVLNKLPKPRFKPEINRARRVIQCTECHKGRLLFSEKRLNPETKDALETALISQGFVCGYELFPDDDPLNNVIFQLSNNCCKKPMTAMYYATKKKGIKGFKPICSTCQAEEPFAVEEKTFAGLPRCTDCQEKRLFIQHRVKKS